MGALKVPLKAPRYRLKRYFVDRLGFIGLIGFINHLVNLISQFIILIKALITPVNLVSSVRFTKTL